MQLVCIDDGRGQGVIGFCITLELLSLCGFKPTFEQVIDLRFKFFGIRTVLFSHGLTSASCSRNCFLALCR